MIVELTVEEALELIRQRLPSLGPEKRRDIIVDLSSLVFELDGLSAAEAELFLRHMLGESGRPGHA